MRVVHRRWVVMSGVGLAVVLVTQSGLATDAAPSPGVLQIDAGKNAGTNVGVTLDASAVDGAGDDDASPADRTLAVDAGQAEGASDAEKIWTSCMEHVPEGVTRPKLTNTFPKRGLAGYALALKINLEHGLGEKVLPNGFRIQSDSDAARAVAEAGFALPSPDGGAGPTLTVKEHEGKGATEVVIHFVSLPDKPGRHELTLPPIPIAVSRASGELLTLCTTPHRIVIDEPIANEPEASPQGNPPPRPQREIWTLGRDVTYGIIAGALAAALITWLVLLWMRRPKPPAPPPPPRPPWEVAFESLDQLRKANLIALGKQPEYMDRVSDVVRIYLGALFEFDGIESTTDEVLIALGKISPPIPVFDEVRTLLQDSDLVKFARWSPTDTDCVEAMTTAERIIQATMPTVGAEPGQPNEPHRSDTQDSKASDSSTGGNV